MALAEIVQRCHNVAPVITYLYAELNVLPLARIDSIRTVVVFTGENGASQ